MASPVANSIFLHIIGSGHTAWTQQAEKILNREGLYITSWSPAVVAVGGLVVTNVITYREQLLSFLQLQALNGYRIIVIHNSALEISVQQELEFYQYGAEYLYPVTDSLKEYTYITERLLRWCRIEAVLCSPLITRHIIGECTLFKQTLRTVAETALFSNMPVLVTGERGTGKEAIAHIIHELDGRREKTSLVLLDCSTIKKDLSGSEFFGHERGAFTGADNSREGAFASAHNGTLFLDEIGELPTGLQAELLRVIQEGTYKKLGSNTWKYTSFRTVCATNRNLNAEAEKGYFRSDLLDRISTCTIHLPPLHQRRQDIPLLADFFLRQFLPGKDIVVRNEVMSYLRDLDFPGNIRQLRQMIHRMATRYLGSGPLTLGDIEQPRETKALLTPAVSAKELISNFISSELLKGQGIDAIQQDIRDRIIDVALGMSGKNKLASVLLKKSDRWLQLELARREATG